MQESQIKGSSTHQQQSGALFVDLEGPLVLDSELELIQDPRVGGLIFFARNYQSPSQMQALTCRLRQERPDLILTVDQEGGRVQRFKEGVSRLPAFDQLALAGTNACEDLAWIMCREILALGIDLSFTPVLDINYGHNEVIGNRAFGTSKADVVRFADAYLRGMAKAGMPATGKHFPGHGWVDLDSHHALPVDARDFEAIADQDLGVFALCHAKLAAVMTAHVLYYQVDDKIATYSKKWLNLLRQDIGFKGLVFSDDLAMAGATGVASVIERAETALDAGCDLLLMCNNRAAVQELLASDQAWYTTNSLDSLRGQIGTDFNCLAEDSEYQEVRRRWQSLI